MPTRPIRFFHRGRIVALSGVAATRTVLDWLREEAGCTGTKEGCAEGDCGACTVVVGELDPSGALQLRNVNACIRFLPTLDGKALFTIEDLAPPDGPLHPVQQAMVDAHASQCGFCTPGFVMSLWACQLSQAQAGTRPDRAALADALAGNLCRCTGYRPILDAAQSIFEHPAPAFDAAPVVAALRTLAADPPLDTGTGFRAPRTLPDFAALRLAHPQARVLAGATDIGLWVTKQLRELPPLLYIGEVTELRRIESLDGALHIGAAVALEDAWAALATRWPPLRDMWLRFASPPVRHAGTLGGNLANGSPIGDAAPVLMALDAGLLLRRGGDQRRMPLDLFYVDYLKNRLEPGEFLQAIIVPPPDDRVRMRAYKVSKRFDSDISALSAGLAVRLDQGHVAEARLVFGGMAATVRRARHAETALVGRPWDESAVGAAIAGLALDFQPITDLRASAAYRQRVAGNLLRRFWLETRDGAALTETQVSVFARGAATEGAA